MKKFLSSLTVLGIMLLGIPAFGAEYTIDNSHTSLGFAVKHLMVSTVRGEFTDFQGTITYDPADLSATQINVNIQANSIDTRNADRDKHLRGAEFFDVDKYPTVTFASNTLKKNGDGYILVGDLTIKGITKTIEIPVTIAGPVKTPFGADAIGLSGQTTINRQDFGVSWNKQMDQGGYVVENNVLLDINVEAHSK